MLSILGIRSVKAKKKRCVHFRVIRGDDKSQTRDRIERQYVYIFIHPSSGKITILKNLVPAQLLVSSTATNFYNGVNRASLACHKAVVIIRR